VKFVRSGLVVVASSVLLAACATVTRGTTEQIQFNSEPSGAHVRTSLNHECDTPCTLAVSRKDEFAVVFTKDGYESQTLQVTTAIAGAGAAGFAGNVLIGGVVGMGVDAATGSTLEHKPNPVVAVLRKLGPQPKVAPAPKGKKAKAVSAPKVQAGAPAPELDPEAPAE
jgi:predicted small secreted protein